MGKSHRTLLSQASVGLRDRTLGLVRPAIEAVLAAAVVLGFVQAGLSALNPNAASASGPDGTPNDPIETGSVALTASPFAPEGGSATGLELTQLNGLRLVGVRMADDPTQSGAILSLGEGRQEAFMVGQDLLAGIRLDAVLPNSVVVSYAGGSRVIAMPNQGGPSYAQALMGHTSLADPALAHFGAAEQAWLAASIADPVTEDGVITGYRLASAVPAIVADAGFVAGDVVIAINGASAGEPLAAIAALQAGGPVSLSVRRADGSIQALTFSLGDAP